MNQNKYGWCLLFGLILLATPQVFALDDKDNDNAFSDSVTAVDTEAQTEEGKKGVIERLKKRFHIDEGQIQDLRDKHLGYGEIGIVYSLAEHMPGGIMEQNINQILELHRSGDKPGWDKIA